MSDNFLYNDKPIESVSKHKYLGIEFSLLAHAISNISNRGMKALVLLKSYICSDSINPGLGLKLFDRQIIPILCYG